jgi:hypothetical protein
VKLTKCQNHHHHGGVFDTWNEWAKPRAERAQGPAGQGLSQFDPRLRGHVSTREDEGQGGGSRSTRSDGTWLGRPAATWRVTASAKLVEHPHDPINTPPPVEIRRHTLLLRNSTCKALILSVVARCRLVRRVARL